MPNTQTIIRVPLVACIVCRDGQRGTVKPNIPFQFQKHEVDSIAKSNPNFLRAAADHEVAGAVRFSELKDLKKIKGAVSGNTGAKREPEPSEPQANTEKHSRADLEEKTLADLVAIAAADDKVTLSAADKKDKAKAIEAIMAANGEDEL